MKIEQNLMFLETEKSGNLKEKKITQFYIFKCNFNSRNMHNQIYTEYFKMFTAFQIINVINIRIYLS